MHGMNVQDTRGKSHFYERTVFETRIFPDYACLWPIPISDIYKDKRLVQNPKWSEISSSTMDDGYGVEGSGN
ncbi:MAG: RagB/SusD family nutrient uptake outer membrane protein, partial [Muribaculaceae bacterium]|nr:RagB/SusD family nutrient uptake outer membrane protein [Muribaculaceae bacterium]